MYYIPLLKKKFITQSCPTLCDPTDCSLSGSPVLGILQARYWNGCHFLLQGIFPTQGSNPDLLYCRQILYQLSYQGIPKLPYKPAIPLLSIYPEKTILKDTCKPMFIAPLSTIARTWKQPRYP